MTNKIRYGNPVPDDKRDDNEPVKAYAIEQQFVGTRDQTHQLRTVLLDLNALNLDWVDEHSIGHTIYYAGDKDGEIGEYIEPVDIEAESEAIAAKSVLTERETQAYMLKQQYQASRQDGAKIMGVEPNTFDTFRKRAEEKIEKAKFTVEWA